MGMGVGWVGGRADLEKNANNFAEVLVAKKNVWLLLGLENPDRFFTANWWAGCSDGCQREHGSGVANGT